MQATMSCAIERKRALAMFFVAFGFFACTPGGVGAPASGPVKAVPEPRAPGPAMARAGDAVTAGALIEVRLLCLAPSPYTGRHDALRAGYGVYVLLQDLILEKRLPIALRYYDASEFYEDTDKIARVLTGAKVLVVGGSTWVQGPAYYVRRFFEKAGSNNLLGVSASAWATAGGAHTGGEVVVDTTLRSLMGMGAQVFTLGQKYMVFTTDERVSPANPGYFSEFDIWYMDQFARTIAVMALTSGSVKDTQDWANALGTSPHYYRNNFPPSQTVLDRYGAVQKLLNEAADPTSSAYRNLRAALSSP